MASTPHRPLRSPATRSEPPKGHARGTRSAPRGGGGTTAGRRAAAAGIVAALAVGGASVPPRLGAQPTPTTRPDTQALQEVTSAERAFSRLSTDRGMRPAFLANLSDSGVVFRPLPVNGKQWWTARANPKATLKWEPERAEVSFGKDFAVSTGPWILTSPPDQKAPPRYGRFLSIWRRQADGSWKVDADVGITHEAPYRGVGNTTFRAGPVRPAPGPNPTRLNLSALDDQIRSPRGVGDAYNRRGADDFLLLRDGYFPYDRPSDAIAALDSLKGRVEATTLGGGAARTEDMAYTYGTLVRFAADMRTPVDTTAYFHVWRRMPGAWKVAIAVHNPVR